MAPFKMNMGSKEKDTKGPFSKYDTNKINKANPKLGKVYQFDTTPEVRGGAGFLGFLGGSAIKLGQGVSKLFKASKTKNVPIIGKPGKTVKVPKSSKTKQVSYVNPRISMTKAQREAAGY